MNDLRKAAEMALDVLLDLPMAVRTKPQAQVIQTLRQALSQPEQEPVAWGMQRKDGVIIDVICPEEHSREPGDYTIPLYTAQPKREFVGLAKEEKFKVLKEFFGNSQQMIDAVEAKLKEKNNG